MNKLELKQIREKRAIFWQKRTRLSGAKWKNQNRNDRIRSKTTRNEQERNGQIRTETNKNKN